jgi:hypothetical protein
LRELIRDEWSCCKINGRMRNLKIMTFLKLNVLSSGSPRYFIIGVNKYDGIFIFKLALKLPRYDSFIKLVNNRGLSDISWPKVHIIECTCLGAFLSRKNILFY